MTTAQAARTDRPYPMREGQLPRDLGAVTPRWLTGLLQRRYPGIEVNGFEQVEIRNGHTTKLRVALDLNEAGRAAGIPRNICLKSNWSEGFESGEICELEARFYHYMRGRPDIPVPDSYFSDWDGDGGGRGVVMMEDLALAPGEFGHSTHQLGVDGVAKGLESLAKLHAALWGSAELAAQRWLPQSMDHPVDHDQLKRMWDYIRLNLRNPDYRAVFPRWLYDTPELRARVRRAGRVRARAGRAAMPGPWRRASGQQLPARQWRAHLARLAACAQGAAVARPHLFHARRADR